MAAELVGDALALAAERLVEVAGLALSPLAQPARRQLGDLVGPRIELRQQLFDVARRRRQQPRLDDVVRRLVGAAGQRLLEQVEGECLGLAGVGPAGAAPPPRLDPPGGEGTISSCSRSARRP